MNDLELGQSKPTIFKLGRGVNIGMPFDERGSYPVEWN